jgi:hypothetical protein
MINCIMIVDIFEKKHPVFWENHRFSEKSFDKPEKSSDF